MACSHHGLWWLHSLELALMLLTQQPLEKNKNFSKMCLSVFPVTLPRRKLRPVTIILAFPSQTATRRAAHSISTSDEPQRITAKRCRGSKLGLRHYIVLKSPNLADLIIKAAWLPTLSQLRRHLQWRQSPVSKYLRWTFEILDIKLGWQRQRQHNTSQLIRLD